MFRQQARRFVAVRHAQLAPGAVAVGIDGGLGHAQLPGDLFGAQMAVHEAQAFPLPGRQELDTVLDDILRLAHKA